MAIYYSEDCANRIRETYERLCALMNEVFQPSKCTGAWRLIRRCIRNMERDLPYSDEFFNPYSSMYCRRCTTVEGMDQICLFFYRKDFLSYEFRRLPNAGKKTVEKLEEVHDRLYGDDI